MRQRDRSTASGSQQKTPFLGRCVMWILYTLLAAVAGRHFDVDQGRPQDGRFRSGIGCPSVLILAIA